MVLDFLYAPLELPQQLAFEARAGTGGSAVEQTLFFLFYYALRIRIAFRTGRCIALAQIQRQVELAPWKILKT